MSSAMGKRSNQDVSEAGGTSVFYLNWEKFDVPGIFKLIFN